MFRNQDKNESELGELLSMATIEDEMQGGGQRGGPRRWTGKGPRPARHIPWPELFKHHQSVLTGHLKMMDMVRKHCVEGTGNHTTAQACVDRTHEMIRMFKKATATFIPPRDSIDRVPLGASSASMYPGYSPADHIYGEAAAEFGKHVSELKKKGIELPIDPQGPEFGMASSKAQAKLEIDEVRRKEEQERAANQSGHQYAPQISEPMEDVQETDTAELFMFDSNPTPVTPFEATVTTSLTKGKNKANDKANRRISKDDDTPLDISNDVPQKKSKLVKELKHQKEPSGDDFERQAESKHKEKEEKRKAKKDKKRKRDSEVTDVTVEAACIEAADSKVGKPKKKKSKKDLTTDSEDRGHTATSTTTIAVDPVKKVKRKTADDDSQDAPEVADGNNKKKKQKKHKPDT